MTGAAEAQVNFTSLVIDKSPVEDTSINHELLLHKSVLKNSESASSIPEKHHTHATYKKYLTPESPLQLDFELSSREVEGLEQIDFISYHCLEICLLLPLSNSPPSVVISNSKNEVIDNLNLQTTETFNGEFAVDNNFRGLGSL